MRVAVLIATSPRNGFPVIIEVKAFELVSSAVRYVEKEVEKDLVWESKTPATITATEGTETYRIVELDVDGQ